MATRMDRYYEKPRNPRARSARNESLYKRIQDLETYSNIEAVATISKTNEIDITKVKEMVQNRENYKKEKKYRTVLNIDEEEKRDEPVKDYFEKEKNYDIMDVLNKAKDGREDEDNKNRSLKNTHYDVLKELNLRRNNYEDGEEELKDLINTITRKKDGDDELDLFEDLKSDTMVGEASSIHKLLEEEKRQQEKIDNTAEMDKTFFTSTIGFSEKDFEDLQNIKHHVKRNNVLIISLLIAVSIIIIGLIIFFIVRR